MRKRVPERSILEIWAAEETHRQVTPHALVKGQKPNPKSAINCWTLFLLWPERPFASNGQQQVPAPFFGFKSILSRICACSVRRIDYTCVEACLKLTPYVKNAVTNRFRKTCFICVSYKDASVLVWTQLKSNFINSGQCNGPCYFWEGRGAERNIFPHPSFHPFTLL